MNRGRLAARIAALLLLLPWVAVPASSDEVAGEPPSWPFLESIRVSDQLQNEMTAAVEEFRAKDAALRRQTIRATVIDLPVGTAPRLAHWNGESPVYPASVPKFVYLMAAYAWRDAGRLEIDPAFDRQLQAMVYRSSNRATQEVVRKLTATQPGPRLDAEDYEGFAWRRHAVKRWLQGLGVRDLHLVHPTYDGGGDLYGRDLQFLEDKGVEGSLPGQKGPYFNRQAMTSDGTARLLALLATDRAFAPKTSAEVRERMRRDTRAQPYLVHRIAGGADGREGYEVFSKTGTWGPIFADAGIVRHRSGRQLVVAVFLEGKPAYRGSFIARLTRRMLRATLDHQSAGLGQSSLSTARSTEYP